MNKALLIIGAPGYNRGSEILLTGILKILKESGKYKTDITAFAIRESWEQENKYLYDKFIPRETPYSTFWYKVCNNIGIRLVKKWGYGQIQTWFMRQGICGIFHKYKLIIFVGADNFDYKYEVPNELNSLISLARKTSFAKIAILNCSISASNINRFFIRNIKQVNIVTARDSLSANNIREYRSDVIVHADPAFGVKPKKCGGYIENGKHYIGVNISPLVLEINRKVEDNINYLIRWVLQHTEENILLIPHVMKQQDYPVLCSVKHVFQNESRVVLLEEDEYSACELKYLISQCDAFVGARTHAMIAAYSSCVPALGIGYSIKAEGIARDFLGERNYCLQADKIRNEDDILRVFIQLWNERKEIKDYMQKKLPDYVRTLEKLGEIL